MLEQFFEEINMTSSEFLDKLKGLREDLKSRSSVELLRASQIASLIERGIEGFPYRDPQSDKIIPVIALTSDEIKALLSLGKLNRRSRVKRVSRSGHLGCCGDCEQWVFEDWSKVVGALLGKIDNAKFGWIKISGLDQLKSHMLKNSYSRQKFEFLASQLPNIYKKFTIAILNKFPNKYYHFDEGGFPKADTA